MDVCDNEYTLNFVKYEFDDKRRYNSPTSSEVALIIMSKDGSIPDVDLKVYPKQPGECQTTCITFKINLMIVTD